MKTLPCLCRIFFLSWLLTALFGAAVTAHAAESPLLTVAVFNFESGAETGEDAGRKIAILINALLSAEPKLITVERAELEKVLGEQELSLSGTISPATAAQVGHLTGAKVLVTGRVFSAGKETIAVAKIIGTETGRVYGELAKGLGTSDFTEVAGQLARKIVVTLTEKGETLVAKTQPAKERIAALIKSLPNTKRPAVSVRISEEHFPRRVVDPAAGTELLLVLRQAGFTIVDDQSQQKPDLEVSGEAFSALAMRKGNLVSCKARIEIKVHDFNQRTLRLADRQTSVAVDITEQTAAKAALENAALELAERLLPQLLSP